MRRLLVPRATNWGRVYPALTPQRRVLLFLVLSLLCHAVTAEAAYKIDGALRDWGVTPGLDWQPDSPTANYIERAGENYYNVFGYSLHRFDMEAMYFDDDENFFYVAVATKFPFATFPSGGPPIPRTDVNSGGDLGLDFDIAPRGVPNSDIGMDVSEHGRVVMKGPPGQSTLGLDYGVRIGSTKSHPLGQLLSQPDWQKTTLFTFEGEGWQGGPWRMFAEQPVPAIGLANIAFGYEQGSYIIEAAIPRHIFPESESGDGLLGLHLTMFCGNDSLNLVATYTPTAAQPQQYFPLRIEKEIVTAQQNGQETPVVNSGDLVDYLVTVSSDRNTFPLTDVTLVEDLPPEVSFEGIIQGNSQGTYDPDRHTYTCSYPSLLPGETRTLHLQVRVANDLAEDTLIANTATVDAFETEPNSVTAVAIARAAILDRLVISKVIINGGQQVQGQHRVEVGELITYDICFTNPNDRAVTNVSILDILPADMAFIAATGETGLGQYNPNAHTFAWSMPVLNAGESFCLGLSARVREFTSAETRLLNRVTIDCDQTESSSAEAEAFVNAIVYQPLNVSMRITSVNGEAPPAAIPLVEAGDVLTYEICFDNTSNNHPVHGVEAVDHLPADVLFLGDDTQEQFGRYDPNSHTYSLLHPSLVPGASSCFTLTVQVGGGVAPEAVLVNRVAVGSDETDPNEATAVAVVKPRPQPLGLIKQIVRGGQLATDGMTRFLNVEEEVAFALCYSNGNPDRIVSNVVITDALPAEMVFVRASGDGEFGQYNPQTHSYTWTIPSLAPGEGQCLELTARVPGTIAAGTRVINRASIRSNETELVDAEVEAIVNIAAASPLNLSKRISAVNQTNVSSTRPNVDPGNTLTYEIRFHNRDNSFPIRELVIEDALPAEVVFMGDVSQGPLGQYDLDTHRYTWGTESLAPGQEVILNLAVLLREDVTMGSTVTNVVTLNGLDIIGETATAEADVGGLLQGTMTLSPLILGRRGTNRTHTLEVVVTLPMGVLRNAVRSDALILEPGGIPAQSQEVFVEKGTTKVRAFFGLADLFQAIPLNGLADLTVRGRLDSGRGFVAEATVLLVEERPF